MFQKTGQKETTKATCSGSFTPRIFRGREKEVKTKRLRGKVRRGTPDQRIVQPSISARKPAVNFSVIRRSVEEERERR